MGYPGMYGQAACAPTLLPAVGTKTGGRGLRGASTLVGPLREGSSEEEPRFVVGFLSVTASNLVQLVRLHEIGARLSASSVCGAATWPYQENPDMTGLRGANANGYLRRCRVTAPQENPRTHAFAGPGNHSRGDAPVIFVWVFDFVPTHHPG